MWYDLIVLGILLAAAYRGLQRGVIYQVAAIASVVLCFVFSEVISAVVAPAIPLAPPLNYWVAMVVAFVGLSFLSFGTARVLDAAVEKAKMREFNRHLGAAFGLVKGVAFCLVLTFFLVTMSPKARSALSPSRSARYAAVIMHKIHPVMPEKLQIALERYIDEASRFGNGQTAIAGDPLDPLGEAAGRIGEDLGRAGDFGGWDGGDAFGDRAAPPRSSADETWDPFGDLMAGDRPDRGGAPTLNGRPTLPDPSGIPDPRNGNRPYGQPAATPNSGDPNSVDPNSVDSILARLPYTVTGEAERYLRGVLNQAPAGDRPLLERRLRESAPEAMGDITRAYLASRGGRSSGTPSTSQRPSAGQVARDYLGGVAGDAYDARFGTDPQARQTRDTLTQGARDFYNRRSSGDGSRSMQDDARDVVGDIASDLLSRRLGGPNRGGQQSPGGQFAPGGQSPQGGQRSNTGGYGPLLGDAAGTLLGGGRPAAPPAADINALAATFSADPQVQRDLVAELTDRLRDVDPAVSRLVIEDWTADRRRDRVDPDSTTDQSTKLADRIRAATRRSGRTQLGSQIRGWLD